MIQQYAYLQEVTGINIEEMLDIFPEALSILHRDLIELEEYAKEQDQILKDVLKTLLTSAHKRKFDNEEERTAWMQFIKDTFYNIPMQETKNHIKKIERIINARDFKKKPSDADITDNDIAHAKQLSLSKVMNIPVPRSGFIVCPFHNERTASCKIYNDSRWHCYSCGEGGDTIDFIMKKHNLTFVEAVKNLKQ